MDPLGNSLIIDLWPSKGTICEIIYLPKRCGCIIEVEELLLLSGKLI